MSKEGLQTLYYDVMTKEFKSSIYRKAKIFIENDCIKVLSRDRFECLPIRGYNKTTYTITNYNEIWHCNCQFHTKTKKVCSHIKAVIMYIQGYKK